MVECKYRIAVDKSQGKDAGVAGAYREAFRRKYGKDSLAVLSANLQQEFNCGLCQLLTVNDIGPMECQQPEHSETTCPDIAHLRDQSPQSK